MSPDSRDIWLWPHLQCTQLRIGSPPKPTTDLRSPLVQGRITDQLMNRVPEPVSRAVQEIPQLPRQ
jgi:hypothetical protein